jgi:hypothetical protein
VIRLLYVFKNARMERLKETLIRYLPQLTQMLEDRYGQMLDNWLSDGSLSPVSWELSPSFQISEKLIKSFIRRVIVQAIKNEDLGLDLAGMGPFKPTQIEQFVNTICSFSVVKLQEVTKDSIAKALWDAPTELAKRELIEIVIGRRPAPSLKEKEDYIGYLVDTDANPLPMPAKALIELRYQPKPEAAIYTELSDGELHPVWREIEDVLPEEVLSLIAIDDSTWK